MQIYDILMAIVLIGAMVFGACKGFAWQLASIVSIGLSYTVAYHYREPFSQNIHAEPPWNRFLAMLILFVGTSIVIWVALRMIAGTIDRMKLKEFDAQIGALFGLGKGAIFCVLITLFAVTLLGERSRQAIIESRSGRWIAQLLDQSDAIMPEELAAVVRPSLQRFGSKADSSGLANSWSSEAALVDPSMQPPGWQSQPGSGWPAGVSPGANRSPDFSAAPQWQQATRGQTRTGY